jgi:autotransporter-associated beta strand protein
MPLTLSGNISGGVKVIQYGPGTLMLSGDNSYTGGTGVLSTLIVGGPSALPAANLALYSGGTINLNGYNVTLDAFWNNGGTITDNSSSSGVTTLTLDTGSGAYYYGTIQDGANGRQVAVEVAGGGLILYGANTYTGGTTIDAGTQLIVGYFGDTGSLTGNIVDNGQLFFATAGTTVYSGNISGSGSVVVCVPGTLILTGNATVTGGTTVDAGSTLQISDGTTNGSVTGSIVDNAILDFVLNSVATVNTAISGNSASQIVNNGAGELTLTGLDAYYGSLGSGIQT